VISNIASSAPFAQSGRLRPLAVSGAERSAVLPNVPTVAEQGFKGFAVGEWFGVIGPAAMPADVTRRLNTEISRTMKTPEVSDRLRQQGIEPKTSTPEEFWAFIE